MPFAARAQAPVIGSLGSVGATLAVCLTACSYDAWLGGRCPESDRRCDDAGLMPHDQVVPVHEDAADAGQTSRDSAATQAPPAESPAAAQSPAPAGAGAPARACRKVTMSFFACAGGQEMPGIPQLQGGRAYTLRLLGAYDVDTQFQVQGSTAGCTLESFGTLTLRAGEPDAMRCITPSEDVALLFSVTTGDVQVWTPDGLRAEVCDGCS